jgi:chromosome segregation ATPase
MAPRAVRPAHCSNENILEFVRSSTSASGAQALDLVYQAAEVFSGIEDRARKVAAQAQADCEDAAERARRAEARADSAEQSLSRLVTEVTCKLQDASKALTNAETMVAAAEDKAAAAQLRADEAEAKAREASQALALVEEAIRRRLLCASPPAAIEPVNELRVA